MPKKIYKELSINDMLFGPNYIIYDWVETEASIEIYIKSKKKKTACPFCGHETMTLHNTYDRRIQIMTIRMKTTYVNVKCYKYKCLNDGCDQKVIMDELGFASPSQVKSDDLICTILGISAFLSYEGASKVLKALGIRCSNDTVKRLCDHILIEDDADVEEIGVDDVATRKGQTYATAIYDMKDHHLLALLDGRDGRNFREWLKGHPKITKVTRDRASAYAKAISDILPDCTQIADRFYMLQNLLGYLEDIFKAEVPSEIVIQDGEIKDSPEMEPMPAYGKVFDTENMDYDNSKPTDENGKEIEFDTTVAVKTDAQYRRHAENRKKQQLIREMQAYASTFPRKSKRVGMTFEKFGICPSTARKYLNMSPEKIESIDHVKAYKKRDRHAGAYDYFNIIYKAVRDGHSREAIYCYIMGKGFAGTHSQLMKAITSIAANNFGRTFGRPKMP